MAAKMKWSKIGIVAWALLGLLATAGLLYAASEGADAHGGVPPAKLKDLLWRVLNFAALLFILVKFLTKPIANVLSGRRQSISDQFENLDARRAEAELLYKEHEAKLAQLDEEVKKIISAAVAQGELEKEKILEEANRTAEGIKQQAELAVQYQFTEAKRKLRKEIAEQAAAMAEEIISKSLQEADQAKLIEDYLNKVEGLK
jgi:F-type H+-transporting ATPase subunit b